MATIEMSTDLARMITSILSIGLGGTGSNTALTAFNNLAAGLGTATGDFNDNTYFITTNNSGATNDYYRRSYSILKGNIKTYLTPNIITSIAYSGDGNAVTALSLSAAGVLTVTKGATYNNYSLPLATGSTRGGVKIGYTTDAANRNYAVQLSNEQMYVNVPWVDHDHYAWTDITGKPNRAGSDSDGGPAQTVKGAYTSNGGKQNPNYFGTNKIGFLMMNTTVNNNSHYKDWIIMDCYSGNDVGGGVAFGVNRQALGAYIMRSAAARTSWAESAELIGTHNYTTYCPTKTGSGASGTWGINITGSAGSVAWGNVTGKPSTFTPSSHTHTIGQITWNASENLVCNGTSTEWSIDMASNATGSYWHVWSGVNGASCLICYNDNRHVAIPVHLYVGGYNDTSYGLSTNNLSVNGHCNINTDGAILLDTTSGGTVGGSQPTALSYGRLQAYGNLCLNANTDNNGTEYVILTAGKGVSSTTTDGMWVGSNEVGIGCGPLKINYKSGTWVNSLTNSAITLPDATGSYGGWICGPTKDGRIAISTYQNSDNYLYLGYGERERTTNSFAQAIRWDGPNNILYLSQLKTSGKIWVRGGDTDAGGNTNRLTTTGGMPGDMQYNVSRRGTQIYANGIAFCDPYNGNSNSDAGWIRHQETTGNAGELEIATGDDSDEPIVVRQYNTSNGIARTLTLLDASGNTTVPGRLNVVGTIAVSTNNTSGGGIILSDDGDIVDLNDSYCSMRFSGGVRIFSAKSGGSAVITLANSGVVTAAAFSGPLRSTGSVSVGTSVWGASNPWNCGNRTLVWGQSGSTSASSDTADMVLYYGTHSSAGGAGYFLSIDGGINSLAGIYTSVWNDFAEYRASDVREPGYAIAPAEDGKNYLTTERMQPGARIISDTFGQSVGYCDEARTPIGVSGRVLAYPARAREEYHIGDCVCAAPDGKIDIMTREEIQQYPDRIIGIVNEVPTYEVWERTITDEDKNAKQRKLKTKVKGRIWIDIK